MSLGTVGHVKPRKYEYAPAGCMVVSAVDKGRHMNGALFHEMKLIPPIYVNPVDKQHKSDDADAIAVAESRPKTRTVDVTTWEQQCLVGLVPDRLPAHEAAHSTGVDMGNNPGFALYQTSGIYGPDDRERCYPIACSERLPGAARVVGRFCL